MRYDECRVGQRVLAENTPPAGTIESLNDRDRMVWVKFGVPDRPGITDLDEFDPGDLELVEE